MVDRARLEAEARRLFLRYAREVVEALGFCPWAEEARLAGRVRIEVVRGERSDVAHAVDLVIAIERDDAIDVGILIFPELVLDRVDFQHHAAAVREAYAARATSSDARMAIADFHPDASPDLGSAERLVSFVRRTPDPVLQLVRERALASVRMTPDVGTRFVDPSSLGASARSLAPPPEPVSTRVARANLRTVERLGVDHVRASLDEILADREASYAALGLPPAPWRLTRAGLRTT